MYLMSFKSSGKKKVFDVTNEKAVWHKFNNFYPVSLKCWSDGSRIKNHGFAFTGSLPCPGFDLIDLTWHDIVYRNAFKFIKKKSNLPPLFKDYSLLLKVQIVLLFYS